MQVLCKHDAMSCRSFVRTWVLESVWVLNPDIHAYQWKIRNVSSLFVSDLSLLTPLHCLTSFPRTPSSLPSAWSSHNHCSLRIPACCTFQKSLFQYLQVMIFFLYEASAKHTLSYSPCFIYFTAPFNNCSYFEYLLLCDLNYMLYETTDPIVFVIVFRS